MHPKKRIHRTRIEEETAFLAHKTVVTMDDPNDEYVIVDLSVALALFNISLTPLSGGCWVKIYFVENNEKLCYYASFQPFFASLPQLT